MTPLPFVWPYALVFWLLFFATYWSESRIVNKARKSIKDEDSLDAGSCRVIMFGSGSAFLLAFPLAWVAALRFPPSMALVLFIVGSLLMIAGSLLRRHCWKMLGASFTGDVRIPVENKVITTGAYSLLRHPSYTGGILMYAGIALALGSWASVLLAVVTSFAVYAYRIKVEERVLLGSIGEPYKEFMNTRKRLIPFIY